MPSACHPSKKAGSCSTHRRYFSIAAGSSPMARSPFASSKSSSISDGISSIPTSQADGLLSLQKHAIRGRDTVKSMSPSLATQDALPSRSLAEDRRPPSLLQLHSQPFPDREFLVVAIFLGISGLFELRILLLVHWIFTNHVNDQSRVLILQKLRSLIRIEFHSVHGHESGKIDVFPGVRERKRLRRLGLVASVLGGLDETDSFLDIRIDFLSHFLGFRLNCALCFLV